jgi:competence protein ComEC
VPLLLRERSGDYVRDLFAEASGFDGDPEDLGSGSDSTCSHEACVARLRRGDHEWRLLATRSSTRIEWASLTGACAEADIVVADRRLPGNCKPRWLKLDRSKLERTGGVAVNLGTKPTVATVAERQGAHPWAQASATGRSRPQARFRQDR